MIFLTLQKCLALLVMPMGLLWILLMVATWLSWKKSGKALTVVLAITLALYTFFGNGIVGRSMIASLECRIPPIDLATTEPFDAVLVLGAGSAVSDDGRIYLSPSGDRIAQAARIWHLGKARLLVASGACGKDDTFRDLGMETRELWKTMGVPSEATMSVSSPCWITRDEIQAYAQLQKQYQWKRVALVSSAYHLPRAMALAQVSGLSAIPVGSDWRGSARDSDPQSFIPQYSGFSNCQLACWEYLGRWVGR